MHICLLSFTKKTPYSTKTLGTQEHPMIQKNMKIKPVEQTDFKFCYCKKHPELIHLTMIKSTCTKSINVKAGLFSIHIYIL